MKIGRTLRYYRTLLNLTQSEVAELSGINEKYLGRLERDQSVPTIDKVEQLCLALDIRIGDLLAAAPPEPAARPRQTGGGVLFPRTVYYCNCCGCTFQSALSENELENIHCPECGCIFDGENEYIEKSIFYQG